MIADDKMKKSTNRHVLKAWLVHAYTALGVPLAMLATIAIAAGNIYLAAVWIAIAMFIDGTDGNFARKWNVKKYTPHFDGRKLDDITDFLTYTFVPVFFLYWEGIPGGAWQYTLLFVLIASAYGFSNDAAKTNDGFFTGFPSYWNAVAIYLYWLQLTDWEAGLILLALAGLTFAPVKFMSFNETPYLRTLDRSLFALWVVVLFFLFREFEHPRPALFYGSLFYPAFYFGASFYLHKKTSPHQKTRARR